MKFRKFLLYLKVWARARRGKRLLRKASLALTLSERKCRSIEIEYRNREEKLIRNYEEALASERALLRSYQKEMIDRFLQLQKLNPTLIIDQSTTKLPRDIKDEAPEDDVLSENQLFLIEEAKERFIQDGLELGKSPAEIRGEWTKVLPAVLQDTDITNEK